MTVARRWRDLLARLRGRPRRQPDRPAEVPEPGWLDALALMLAALEIVLPVVLALLAVIGLFFAWFFAASR